MQPSPEDFKEWQGHPVTEWVMAQMIKFAGQQKELWAQEAWAGDLSELLLNEARTRADCYKAIPESNLEDWIAIDDSETE